MSISNLEQHEGVKWIDEDLYTGSKRFPISNRRRVLSNT